MIRDTCRSLGQLLVFIGFWAFIFGFLAGVSDATETPWLLLGGLGAIAVGLGLALLAEVPGWLRSWRERRKTRTTPAAPTVWTAVDWSTHRFPRYRR